MGVGGFGFGDSTLLSGPGPPGSVFSFVSSRSSLGPVSIAGPVRVCLWGLEGLQEWEGYESYIGLLGNLHSVYMQLCKCSSPAQAASKINSWGLTEGLRVHLVLVAPVVVDPPTPQARPVHCTLLSVGTR